MGLMLRRQMRNPRCHVQSTAMQKVASSCIDVPVISSDGVLAVLEIASNNVEHHFSNGPGAVTADAQSQVSYRECSDFKVGDNHGQDVY